MVKGVVWLYAHTAFVGRCDGCRVGTQSTGYFAPAGVGGASRLLVAAALQFVVREFDVDGACGYIDGYDVAVAQQGNVATGSRFGRYVSDG